MEPNFSSALPAKLPGITACLIVKNEAEALPACLASLRSAVDEICVIDTGSEDATIALALAAGAHVESRAWHGDFSAARNECLALARHEWILVLDADERLAQESRAELRRRTRPGPALAFLVKRLDLRPAGEPDVIALPRLFRNHPEIRFNRPVHEDVMESLYRLGERCPETTGIQLIHVGYLLAALREDKLARNVAILRQRLLEQPTDLYSTYKLALSLPPSAERVQALALAFGMLDGQLPAALAELPFLPRLFHAAAMDALRGGCLTEALGLCQRGLELFSGSVLLCQQRAELLCAAGRFEEARELCRVLSNSTHLSEIQAESAHSLKQGLARLQVRLALDARSELPLLAPELLSELEVACGVLRVQLRAGALDFVTQAVKGLIETRFESDVVKLLAAELAWARADFDTARIVLGTTNRHSEAGAEAHSLLALIQRARGEVSAVIAPRNTASAGIAQLLQRGARVELGSNDASVPLIDGAFDIAVVAEWEAIWAEELAQIKQSLERPPALGR